MNHKRLFQIAALWNIGLAGMLGLFPETLLSLFQMPQKMTYPVFLYELITVVITFGIGYYWASRDFKKNAPIIKLGMIGKLLVFFTGLYWVIKGPLNGGCSWALMALFVGDFIFAVLFFLALRSLMMNDSREESRGVLGRSANPRGCPP